MTFLLDVNILIALIDPTHLCHDLVHDWFDAEGKAGWATCPITQNGVVRIVSNPRYPNTPGQAPVVLDAVRRLTGLSGHVFWPDDISILDERHVDGSRLSTHAQITDSYLLALATRHGGRLATLDRRLAASAVRGGSRRLRVVSGP